jgi:3',5'-cyclic AMP phosphodiesterase CpdA
MLPSPIVREFSRRRFLHQLLGAGAFVAMGNPALPALAAPPGTQGFRFAFVTDLHLMQDVKLRSAEGIAACLAAVEKLNPRPEFILCGGDLVHSLRDMTMASAQGSLDYFLQLWQDHSSLPVHWMFGNHDLAGTSNPAVSPDDRAYAKGLFRERLQLPRLFYSFDFGGWHFVVLDDIAVIPGHGYTGELFEDELAFLKADLDLHKAMPTLICTHIPLASNLPLGVALLRGSGSDQRGLPKTLVCTNGRAVFDDVPGHSVRAILAGHIHFHEELQLAGVRVVNCGAVCGNYWKGPMFGCPEGFGVVDLGADGSFTFNYQPYGWKA